MRRVITNKTLAALQPAPQGKRSLILDAVVPGLAIRVTDKGHSTYVLGGRFGGSKHYTRRELAEVGRITLVAAREQARAWIELMQKGIDPAVQRERDRAAARRRDANLFRAAADDYCAHIKRAGHRKADVVARIIGNELVRRWGARPVADIDSQDLVGVIEAAIARGAPQQAHRIFAIARALFAWAIARGLIERSPCDRLRPRDVIGVSKGQRQRVLDAREIRALWNAATAMGYPYGDLF